MANSKRFATVVELGERLVRELGVDDSNDTLARWMAHYIAEQLTNAQSMKGAARHSVQQECFRSILELWKHRNALPEGRRPFREWEPLFDTLSTLDLKNPAPRYFRAARTLADQEEVGSKSKEWLRAATSLDYAARVLIRYCLSLAAENAAVDASEWIRLAEKLNRRDDFDVRIVHYVAADVNAVAEPNESDLRRKAVEDMIRRLDAFHDVAKKLGSHLRRQTGVARSGSRRKQSERKSNNTKSRPRPNARTRSRKRKGPP